MDRIIAKAWVDEAFKQRLIADPVATLMAEGIAIPPGLCLKVVENTDCLLHIVLPPKPSDELSRESLESVTGGASLKLAGCLDTGLSACLDPGVSACLDPGRYVLRR